MNKKQNLIYALSDPRTNEIRYIGKSTQGLKRAYQHQKPSELKKSNHKIHWIKQLLTLNLKYNVLVLEYCSSAEITSDREIHWIKFHRNLGANLTNQTDGGEGSVGRIHTTETILKLSKKREEFHKKHPEVIGAITVKQRKQHIFIDGVEHKHCSDCSQNKPLDFYHKSKSMWDKLKSICKICSIFRLNKYKKENPPKILNKEDWKQSYVDRKEKMRQGVIDSISKKKEIVISIDDWDSICFYFPFYKHNYYCHEEKIEMNRGAVDPRNYRDRDIVI